MNFYLSEAERLTRENAELRARVAELEAELAQVCGAGTQIAFEKFDRAGTIRELAGALMHTARYLENAPTYRGLAKDALESLEPNFAE